MNFQVSSTLLEFLVLVIIDREDMYGYSLTKVLTKDIELSESTLYPVLRRLRKTNLLETYDTQLEGRNRRYYRITDKGKKTLEIYKSSWRKYKSDIENIIGETKYE